MIYASFYRSMINIVNEFKLLEKDVKERFTVNKVNLQTFSSGSCALDVVISNVITVFEYSNQLKSIGIYSGISSEELYNAETETFDISAFYEAKEQFLIRLKSLVSR